MKNWWNRIFNGKEFTSFLAVYVGTIILRNSTVHHGHWWLWAALLFVVVFNTL